MDNATAMRSLALGLAASAVLATGIVACSGASGTVPGVAANPGGSAIVAAAHHRARGKASIVIRIPRKKKNRPRRSHPFYISASTQSMTVADANAPTQTFNLTPQSKNCSTSDASGYLTCTETAFFPTGSQTIVVSLYDRQNGSGDVLSTATTTATIAAGAATPISIVLDGVVATAKVFLGAQASTALAIPQGKATSVPLSVTAYDAGGNLILAPGNYATAVGLTDSDASGVTTLSAASATKPGAALTLAYNGGALPSGATITPVVGSVAQQDVATLTLVKTSSIQEFPLPSGGGPGAIALGPDNALWFTETVGNKLARITTDGTITNEFAIPTAASQPSGIASGPDGALWFSESNANQIGRMTTGGTVTNEFPATTSGSFPYGITAGPDGALWFTECDKGQIGRITTAGTLTEYAAAGFPLAIAAGPDNALWFTEQFPPKIGRITTSGTFADYAVANGGFTWGIAAGPDGALWFTDWSANTIDRMTTDGTVTNQYAIPTSTSHPYGIAAGPDGALWFAECNGDKIGRITTGGTLTEYPVPTAGSRPEWIVAGPDNAMWFTESNGNQIGRVPVSIARPSARRGGKRARRR